MKTKVVFVETLGRVRCSYSLKMVTFSHSILHKFRFLAFCLIVSQAGVLWAESVMAPIESLTQDELIFRDGDRLRGHLLSQDEEHWVFISDRFGELTVLKREASVIQPTLTESLGPPVELDTESGAEMTAADEAEKQEQDEHGWQAWDYLNPTLLTNYLREVFGPWKGRFSFSAELVTDTTDRSTITLAAKLKRKWERDNVEMNLRYDYTETEQITTRDLARMSASWRHDFEGRLFGIYTPGLEWNRNYNVGTAAADYLLLQQEVGAGINILNREGRQLRVGLSENLFDVWVSEPENLHQGSHTESVFVETEWKLPWRITMSERGVYYYSLETHEDGWENKFQIDKKLTETLSVGILHELRYNTPDVRVSDYKLLKLLIGLDF